MTGNPDPVTNIAGIATNDDVSKADFMAFEKGNVRGFAASEVPNYDLSGRGAIVVDGAIFVKDTGDTVTPASATVLFDANSIRFKRATTGVGKRIQVRVAATGNVNLVSPGSSIDSVTMAAGNLFLAPAQTNAAQNGVYTWNGASLEATRAPDFVAYDDHAGALVVVSAGTANANTLWFCSANEGGTLGTTDIVFTKLTFPGGVPVERIIAAGAGLTGGGNLSADRAFALSDAQLELPMTIAMMAHADRKGWALYPLRALVAIPEVTVLPSWVSFGRSTSKWLPAPNGLLREATAGVIAHDYDPTTGRYLGWSLEGSSTNLLLRSQELDNAIWNKSRATISANVTVAPDGTMTADKIVEDATLGTHYANQNPTIVATTTYTRSEYLGRAERSWVTLQTMSNPTNTILAAVSFDLSSLTFVSPVTSGGATQSYGYNLLPDGWVRVWQTFTLGGTDTQALIRTSLHNGSTETYTGDGVSGLYMWGYQLEARAAPSNYIPTGASQVTRAADVLTFDVAGKLNSEEGGICIRSSCPFLPETMTVLQLDDGSNSNRADISVSAAGIVYARITIGGVGQFFQNLGTVSAGADFAVAMSWRGGSVWSSLNGAAVITNTYTPPLAAFTTARLGRPATSQALCFGDFRYAGIFGRAPASANVPAISAL